MKRISIALIILLMSFNLSFGATVPNDIDGAIYEEEIIALFEKGIITGDVDGGFHPDSNLTRAQACIMVVKAMNPPKAQVTGTATQPIKSAFSDMGGYSWAEGYISYAASKGVIKGYPDGTFKPGNKVTIEELKAMVVRAAGYTDEVLLGKYPSNYNEKANELGLMEDIITIQIYPFYATKGITAKMIFNGLELIEKANELIPTDGVQEPPLVPLLTGKIFATGEFSDDMKTFDGKEIASDVIIYTYGVRAEYKSTMSISSKAGDYRFDTIYKYKGAETPLWYGSYGGKITSMIIPMDAGFSGNAYGVINGKSTMLNGDGEVVLGIQTLIAGNPINWVSQDDQLVTPLNTFEGDVYKLNMKNGEIRSIIDADTSSEDDFEEITSSFQLIYSYKDGLVRLEDENGSLFEIKDNAAVYVLNEDYDEYAQGRLSSIKEGMYIRGFDISDDDNVGADIVVVPDYYRTEK